MTGRRPLWTVLVLLLLAAAGQWAASQIPFALFCLASVAALVALSGWPRRVLGVVLIGTSAVAAPGWHAFAIASGVCLLVSGVILAWLGHRMPRFGMGGQQAPAPDPERDMWSALERGEDPTESRGHTNE
ncbi:Trp biosynthesis-associated membrane protein [Lentzea tibetensis]|uniref:Trp biosynthesis-associated membrane protein n=1 Tax=Lentzea tibetensis TaxID=2591470 RepID=A0A563ERN6_9PSEU|nr:Trp biosynthesis-associated membrane protein [Lentzea tibetensis]TWP50320.1 Trp biosynthesis-associated membrane protein [Lentzea tibetensis]